MYNGILSALKKMKFWHMLWRGWTLKAIYWNEISQLPKDNYCKILVIAGSQSSQSETGRRDLVARSCGEAGVGYRVSAGEDKEVLKLDGDNGCTTVWVYFMPQELDM